MALLRLANHTSLIVKYLYDNNGLTYFQIRIPNDLRERFEGKTKISIPLHKENGAPVIQVQRLGKSYKAIFRAMRSDPSLGASDQKLAALALLHKYDLKVGDGLVRLEPWDPAAQYDDQPHLAPLLDEMIDISRERELKEHEKLALKALQGPLPTTLSELLEVYFQNHKRGRDAAFRKATAIYWDKLVEFAADIPLEALDREKAKAYVYARLDQQVKRATVEKELKIFRAIVNKGIKELHLKVPNPFLDITIPEGLGLESKDRIKFTIEEHRVAIKAAIEANDELRTIVLVAAFTGCRIGEAVGLRMQDCQLTAATPHLCFDEYGSRRLKTKNSIRKVPVLPPLKAALEAQIRRIGESQVLFPSYNDMDNEPASDSASAAANKWLKKHVCSTKTTHCFRHSVTDLLRDASVSEELRREITGGAKQFHADRYGEGVALAIKYRAIETAFKGFYQ